MLSFNHTNEIANAALRAPNGDLDLNAIGAALSAKFPDGSNADGLTRFVVSIGGKCFEGPTTVTTYCGGPLETRPTQCSNQVNDRLRCTVPVAGTVCVRTDLALQAHINSTHSLSNIIATKNSASC